MSRKKEIRDDERIWNRAAPPTLMVVHAHPDDECLGTGGTLARYSAEGIKTVLVTATRGEEGEIHDPNLTEEEARPRLGEIRTGGVDARGGASRRQRARIPRLSRIRA
ncbi:MAG: PIG-L family deacetylase [Thermomicrobiales bacterium]